MSDHASRGLRQLICASLPRRLRGGMSPHAIAAVALLLVVSSFSARAQEVVAPDYYQVTAIAGFRPVNVPGTQRRVAQNDAEAKARREIYEHVGSLRVAGGKRTVNDWLAKDARLKARMLELIRTAELVDWQVNPQCNSVQVWLRIDLNRVRSLLAAAGCVVGSHGRRH